MCITVTKSTSFEPQYKKYFAFFNAQHYNNQSMEIIVYPIGTLGLAHWMTFVSMG